MNTDESDTISDGQKIPTALLLTPDFNFHSFGTAARDYFHDMHPDEAHGWYYFDKFKMFLYNKDVSAVEPPPIRILTSLVLRRVVIYPKAVELYR